MENQSTPINLSVPMAIVVAGILIAGGIFFSNRGTQNGNIANTPKSQPVATSEASSLEKMKPISAEDHVRGNPDAPVKIVEYSDTECPFCKSFHSTMLQVMNEYGKAGKVAWVYRHFPLDSIHPKSRKEAEATECANELGGDIKFWEYVDRVFAVTPSNNNLDPAELSKIAEYVGLDVTKFESCLNRGKYATHVADNLDEAIATGGQGTPWSIVIAANGKKYPLNGAQPYANVRQLIDIALTQK